MVKRTTHSRRQFGCHLKIWLGLTLDDRRANAWEAGEGVARSACIRSLIRAAMQRTPLHMEGVTREEERTERLSANYSFLKER
jgi:hypothetical protein